jgi:hypothetical protein
VAQAFDVLYAAARAVAVGVSPGASPSAMDTLTAAIRGLDAAREAYRGTREPAPLVRGSHDGSEEVLPLAKRRAAGGEPRCHVSEQLIVANTTTATPDIPSDGWLGIRAATAAEHRGAECAADVGGGAPVTIPVGLCEFRSPPVGIVNQGATCFLSVMLQCWYHTPLLRTIVFQLAPDPPNPVLLELQRVFWKLQFSQLPVRTEVGCHSLVVGLAPCTASS